MNNVLKDVFEIFPDRIKTAAALASRFSPRIQEIRLIADKAVFFYTDEGIRFVENSGYISLCVTGDVLIPTSAELAELTDRAACYSGYLYERELSEGYLTYGKAFRIGICAQNNSLHGGRITSLCIRVPFAGEDPSSVCRIKDMLSFEKGILVAGPPGSGKTTLLRAIAKGLSDGMTGEYKKVCIVDERGEFTDASFCGVCTDVISGTEKSTAIIRAIRLMSPQYIICDEIGSEKETKSLLEGLNSGIRFAASVHAGSIDELIRRRQFRILFDEYVFDKIVLLSGDEPGRINRIFTNGEISDEIFRSNSPLSCCQS